MSRPEPVHDLLGQRLRTARPIASPELRERVLALASAPPPLPPRTWSERWLRRTAIVLAPAAVVVAVAGLASLGSRDAGDTALQGTTTVVGGEATPESAATGQGRNLGPVGQSGNAPGAAATDSARSRALPPSRTRAQEYRAELRVRVESLDELSTATTRAMGIARRLGGYVVRAQFGTGEDEGDSFLVVRVPVTKVQDAVLAFAGLGTVVAQQVSIQDLQAGLNRQNDQIAALRRTIATLERELRRPSLTPEARNRLQARLDNAEDTLKARLGGREATERRGRLSTVALTLTTRDEAAKEPPAPPGKLERTLRDAVGVLATVLTWLLAFLIVAGPFLVLAAAGILVERRRRRRALEQLLERA